MAIKLKDSSGPGYVGRALQALEFQERLTAIVEEVQAARDKAGGRDTAAVIKQYRAIMEETNAFILANVAEPSDPDEARRVLLTETTEAEYTALLDELRGKKQADPDGPKADTTSASASTMPSGSEARQGVAPSKGLSSKRQPSGGNRRNGSETSLTVIPGSGG